MKTVSWPRFWQICTLIIVLVGLVVIIMSMAFSANVDALQRNCIEAVPGRVVGGVGEAGGFVTGLLEMHSSDHYLSYDLRHYSLSPIQSIVIRGPMPVGSQVGPVKVALCGSPSTVVCDITTLAGQVKGKLMQVLPGATDIRPVIADIRKEPWLYYLEVLTSSKPTTPGALRAPLGINCGTP